MPLYKILRAETYAAFYVVNADNEEAAEELLDEEEDSPNVLAVDGKLRLMHGVPRQHTGRLDRTEVVNCQTDLLTNEEAAVLAKAAQCLPKALLSPFGTALKTVSKMQGKHPAPEDRNN